MPFNPAQGVGKKESVLKRAVIALPFLFLFYFAKNLMDPAPLIPWATSILEHKTVAWSDTPLPTRFYPVEWLNGLLAPLIVFFSPVLAGFTDSLSTQAFLLLADYGIVIAIWLIESARRANIFTPSQVPFLFTLASQFVGVGVISPLYYLLHYIYAPIDVFKASDMRLTRVAYTRTILPALLAAYYLPLYASFLWPSFAGRVYWNFLWQLFPLWITLLASYVLFYFFADTTKHDRLHNVRRDLPVIRTTMAVLAIHSAAVWLYAWYQSGFVAETMMNTILPPLHSPQGAKDLVTFTGEFLRFDSAFLVGNTFFWMGLLFWDIKHAGMLELGWVWILVYALVAAVTVGPGATAALGFLWREEILATRRHWAAVTEEKTVEKAHAKTD